MSGTHGAGIHVEAGPVGVGVGGVRVQERGGYQQGNAAPIPVQAVPLEGSASSVFQELAQGLRVTVSVIRRGQLAPGDPALVEVLARISHHIQKGIIGLDVGTVEVRPDHADDARVHEALEALSGLRLGGVPGCLGQPPLRQCGAVFCVRHPPRRGLQCLPRVVPAGSGELASPARWGDTPLHRHSSLPPVGRAGAIHPLRRARACGCSSGSDPTGPTGGCADTHQRPRRFALSASASTAWGVASPRRTASTPAYRTRFTDGLSKIVRSVAASVRRAAHGFRRGCRRGD